jgi:hypothetical protein
MCIETVTVSRRCRCSLRTSMVTSRASPLGSRSRAMLAAASAASRSAASRWGTLLPRRRGRASPPRGYRNKSAARLPRETDSNRFPRPRVALHLKPHHRASWVHQGQCRRNRLQGRLEGALGSPKPLPRRPEIPAGFARLGFSDGLQLNPVRSSGRREGTRGRTGPPAGDAPNR